jgi:(R)-2-hydroxyacyl-CoA dehydratese activating ATPase
MKKKFYLGIDIGSSRTKSAIIDADKNLIGYGIKKSGTDFKKAADLSISDALKMAKISIDEITNVVSTGYGRNNIPMPHDTKTEISCHAKGCYYYFPTNITIIDIGGQDNKIIKIGTDGRRISFKMNRKCAAGTGAFLEEMAFRLDIPIESMNGLAEKSKNMVKLGSFCTVFSATEVLQNIRKGKKVSNIVKGLFYSVIARVFEMDSLDGQVIMTGGVVAHNPFLVKMAEEICKQKIKTTILPQFTGAIGAALYAAG